jgi:hypothetical protein
MSVKVSHGRENRRVSRLPVCSLAKIYRSEFRKGGEIHSSFLFEGSVCGVVTRFTKNL